MIPSYVMLNLIELPHEAKGKKIFIFIKKDHNEKCIAFCKKKFYQDVSTIVNCLAAAIIQYYNKSVIYVFDSCNQKLTKEVVQNRKGILKLKEEQEIDSNLNKQLDQVEIMDTEKNLNTSNKRSQEKVEEIKIKCFRKLSALNELGISHVAIYFLVPT